MIDELKELQDFPPVIQNYSSALITLQNTFWTQKNADFR